MHAYALRGRSFVVVIVHVANVDAVVAVVGRRRALYAWHAPVRHAGTGRRPLHDVRSFRTDSAERTKCLDGKMSLQPSHVAASSS